MTPQNVRHLKRHCREAIRLCGSRGACFTASALRLVLEAEYEIPSGALQTWQVTKMLKEKSFIATADGWTYELRG